MKIVRQKRGRGLRYRLAACTASICLLEMVVGYPAAAQPSWTWLQAKRGTEFREQFGVAVAGIGDVDGDSHADFVVGAPRSLADLGGCALVYSGATGVLINRLGCADSLDYLGVALAGLGDVNGDGVPDFAVGAPYAPVTGAVYVYSGSTRAVIRRLDGGLDAGLIGSRFGWAVAATGDLDGDGRGDLLVGAPLATSGGIQRCGSVFAYSGATGSILLRVDGSVSDEGFGESADGIGDVDGDGTRDLLIGGPSYLGSAILVSGRTGQEILRVQDSSTTPGYDLVVAGAPDMSGDAIPDFVVGLPEFLSGMGSGAATVYSGASGVPIRTHVGPNGLSRFGESVDAGGDPNRDSFNDILVGAPSAGADFEGSAFVYSPGQDSILFRADGASRGDAFGQSVAFVGDINGDGREDFVVGAPFARVRKTQGIPGAAIAFGYVDVAPARGFLSSGSVSISLGAGQQQICFEMEPVSASFDPADVVASSLVLRRQDVQYEEVAALPASAAQIQDADGNGVSEITACFSREDLRNLLFDLQPGPTLVAVSLEGNTVAGLRPRAALALEIDVPGVKVATLAPNPMPGTGVLSFVTSTPGSIQVDLFDGSGRHVKQLLRDQNAPAGPHDVTIDGRGKTGQNLASGVYYFKITSPDGAISGRAVLLR